MASPRGSGGYPTRKDSGPTPGTPNRAQGQGDGKEPQAVTSPVRHNLPQIPTMSPQTSRVAVSKSAASKGQPAAAADLPEKPFANVVPVQDTEPPPPVGNPLASLASMVESKKPPAEDLLQTPSPSKEPGQKSLPSSLPTPPSESSTSDTSPKAAQGAPAIPSQTPPMGIKLRIRRSVQEDGTSQRTSILNPQEATPPASQQHEQVTVVAAAAPPSVSSSSSLLTQTAHSPATPTGGVERPKIGRTKTKGDIKKQLMEKRGKKKLEGQAQSPASTSQSESLDTPPPPVQPLPEKVPLPLAPSKGKPAEMTPEDLEFPPKWLVGDVMWSKVPGHPWWPSMVSFDPFIGIYTKLNPQRAKTKERGRQYHVQFFGNEGERGWIPDSRMLAFEGEEAFQRYAQEKIANDKKVKSWYEVSSRRRKAWMVAVSQANEAYPMTRNERKATFTFTYKIPQKKLPAPASSDQEVTSSPSNEDGVEVLPNGVVRKRPQKRPIKRKVVEVDDSEDAAPAQKRQRRGTVNPGSSPLANKSMAQYMVFCQKRREGVKQENPEWTEEQVEDKLKELWGQLDEDQKSKFIPMGSDVQHISEMIPIQASRIQRSGRVVKLSKKMMDADEENELFQTPTPRKRRRSSMSPRSHPPAAAASTVAPEAIASSSVDDIIDSVSAGAGQIKDLLDTSKSEPMDTSTEAAQDTTPSQSQSRKRVRKKKTDLPSDDGSSTTDSVSLDEFEPGKKNGDPTKKQPVARRAEDELGELDFEVFRLSSHCSLKKETICRTCEQPGDLINCDGPCLGNYHLGCVGLAVAPTEAFKCDECTSGNHTCFVCKKNGTDTKRCSSRDCGRFYHEDCIKRFPHTRFENNHFHCPLHVCGTCMANNPKNLKASKGRFLRCVRCPTAYHTGDLCVSAGSLHLAGLNIVCSRHFQPVKSAKYHSHFSVSWCFICAKGGTLLCCETCPAAFHAECLDIVPPEGAFYCRDCVSGKRPLYGNIIWVKLGQYRWWPGEICHPRNVPLNIQEKSHQVGEFPVHFFGSHDYFWTHQGRVFMFQDGDKGTKDARKGSLARVFSKGVEEAARAYRYWKECQARIEEQEQEKTDKKPQPYKHIKTNLPIGNVQIYKADLSEIARCECKPEMENPCSPESECWNRMLLYECHPAVCPAGERCCNQRFQRRKYPKAEPYKTDGRGWGLRVLEDVKKGQFVSEYVGDLVDEKECQRRMKQSHEDDISNFYMLTLDKNRIIDAGPKGNLSRFMNHSCAPNCETQKWNVNGDVRVGLFAIEDIQAGAELTFNYNLDCLGNDKKVCHCGATNCSGFLGVRPKSANDLDRQQRDSKPKKKKHRRHDRRRPKIHEDDCYRCGDGGEVVLCDKSNCPKVYHLKCLKLSKLPAGSWLCPWHHCDICGKRALKLCSECPNSFCHEHIKGNIFLIPDNKLICHEHQDIIAAIEDSRLESLQNEAEGPKSGASSSSSSDVTTSSSDSSPTHSDSEKELIIAEGTEGEQDDVEKPTQQSVNGKSPASDADSSNTDNSEKPKKKRSRSQSARRKSKNDRSVKEGQEDSAVDAKPGQAASPVSASNEAETIPVSPPSEGPQEKEKRRRKSGQLQAHEDPLPSQKSPTAKNGDSKITSEKASGKTPKTENPSSKSKRRSSGSGSKGSLSVPKPVDTAITPVSPSTASETKSRSKSGNGRKSDAQSSAKADKGPTPKTKTNGRRSNQTPKSAKSRRHPGKNGTNNNQGEGQKKDSPMFDDDSDEFPDLVIDIPNL